MTSTVWMTHSFFRFIVAAHFVGLFCMVILAAPLAEFSHCIFDNSRLITREFDDEMDNIVFGALVLGHFLAITSCFHNDLLWLGIIFYQVMFLFTMFITLGQGMSGYLYKYGVIINLLSSLWLTPGWPLALFIYMSCSYMQTHRGITFYQWIPLMIRELFQYIRKLYLSLTDKNRNPEDHLIQNITGIEYTKRKYEKISLLEEDQEEFEQLIEKTCVEG